MHVHSHSGDRPLNSTGVQHSPQRQLIGPMEASKPGYAPEDLIVRCKHRLDAIRLCVQLASLPHETIATRLGIDKSHWTRIMQGKANFPDAKSVALMECCGNYAPLQYEAWATGHELKNAAQAKIERLERELAEARRAA